MKNNKKNCPHSRLQPQKNDWVGKNTYSTSANFVIFLHNQKTMQKCVVIDTYVSERKRSFALVPQQKYCCMLVAASRIRINKQKFCCWSIFSILFEHIFQDIFKIFERKISVIYRCYFLSLIFTQLNLKAIAIHLTHGAKILFSFLNIRSAMSRRSWNHNQRKIRDVSLHFFCVNSFCRFLMGICAALKSDVAPSKNFLSLCQTAISRTGQLMKSLSLLSLSIGNFLLQITFWHSASFQTQLANLINGEIIIAIVTSSIFSSFCLMCGK